MTDYTWDRRKAADNLRKHGVSFAVAVEVFADPCVDTSPDESHSEGEERYRSLGLTRGATVLLVVHTTTEAPVVRIISARRATPRERRAYHDQA